MSKTEPMISAQRIDCIKRNQSNKPAAWMFHLLHFSVSNKFRGGGGGLFHCGFNSS